MYAFLICLYIFILPLAPSGFKIGKIPVNGNSFIVLIILCYIIKLIINKDSRVRFKKGINNFFKDKFSIFSLMWITIMFISIVYSKDKNLALGESIRFSSYILIYFIIKYEIYKEKSLNMILNSITCTLLIIDIIGILEYIKGVGTIQNDVSGTFIRISSTLENSNNLGALCVLLIFPYIMLSIKEKNNKKRVLYSIISLLTFANIILSFSRNAWIGLSLGLLILVVIYNIKFIWTLGLGASLLLLLPNIRNRIKDITNVTQNSSRIGLWRVGLLMIKDHPILGIGAGNYRVHYSSYSQRINSYGYGPHDKFHPHNVYIKSQCELGIVGLISVILYLVFALKTIVRFSKTVENQYYKWFSFGFIASLVSFMIMNFMDNFFSAPKVFSFFWIIMAVFSCYEYNKKIV
ncbi:O-antigen ligase family protein [Hathewaya histolytica]|uniref:O-antigen ligase family protein n=1 Tax=Hathewaya histolytica TaxID=1498 RepID=UPI003B67546D